MTLLGAIVVWFGRIVLVLVMALGVYVAYARWAYRDIAEAELERKYGGDGLRMIEVDGVPIRYRLQGSGPCVVLIHSHYFEMSMWDPWVKLMAPQFTVLRYDLSGHGLTGPDPTGVYTVERDVALLNDLLDRLGIDRAALVGSSLGGNIAFTFAASAPTRVDALVLVNSGGLKRAGSRSEGRIPDWADLVLPLVPPAAFGKFLRWMFWEPSKVDAPLATRFVDMLRRTGNRQAELARLRQFQIGEPDAVLAKVIAPTLILWGEQNPQLPPTLAAEFQHKLIHAAKVERKMFSGAGHVLPLELPDASAAATISFLRENSGAESFR